MLLRDLLESLFLFRRRRLLRSVPQKWPHQMDGQKKHCDASNAIGVPLNVDETYNLKPKMAGNGRE